MRRRGCSVLVGVVMAISVTACSPPSTQDDSVTTTTEPLVADFRAEVDYEVVNGTNCPVLGVRFIDLSTGDPETWHWSFPDGTTSDEQFPSVNGEMSGTVTLVVTRARQRATITRETPAALTC